jgi:hypothetical protein
MRYECESPFDGCYIEFTDVWTRRDIRLFWDTGIRSEEWFALIVSKMKAVCLDRVGMGPITDPSQLTTDALDDVDTRLIQWINSAAVRAVDDVGTLGEALGRTLWLSAESDATDRPKK